MTRAFSKIWIVSIFIVVIAGGIFAWQYFGVPKDEIANWILYESDSPSFSIKIPSNFEQVEFGAIAKFREYTKNKEEGFIQDEGGKWVKAQIEVVVSPVGYEYAGKIAESIADMRNTAIGNPVEFALGTSKKTKNVDLPGCLAAWISVAIPPNEGAFTTCLYEEGKSTYHLSFNLSAKEGVLLEYIQEYETMLGTFAIGWKTYRNEGFEFQYPATLGLEDIRAHVWPPKIAVEPASLNFSCEDIEDFGNLLPRPQIREETTFSGTRYCIIRAGEGVAGTIYQSYKYTIIHDSNIVTLEFSIRYPSDCKNYSDTVQVKRCEKEMEVFNSTALADQILSTFRFVE